MSDCSANKESEDLRMFHIAWDVYEGRLLRVHRKLESCKEGAMGSELAVAISNEEAGQGLGEMET